MDSCDFVIVGGGRAGCVLAADRTMQSCFHPAGACRMGPTRCRWWIQLRTHGIRGLRIADSSIMPPTVSGNTNATVYVIAERAAALAGR